MLAVWPLRGQLIHSPLGQRVQAVLHCIGVSFSVLSELETEAEIFVGHYYCMKYRAQYSVGPSLWLRRWSACVTYVCLAACYE